MDAGEILCDFAFIKKKKDRNRKREPYKVDITLSGEMKFIMKLNILGMRDLKSLGILPVKRAYIKLDLNMFKGKNQKDKKRVYKT